MDTWVTVEPPTGCASDGSDPSQLSNRSPQRPRRRTSLLT
ncbi:MAG: hypothetical protein AVDCRST_MAG50-1903 [uncultured Acidimicrobiales bacterium]|uniref:Uncharacterized protein n=1 Tax=uncultured Acidimicrobiales bacterium TaxID=310071 RepID=A0A6J4IAB6_9ACTN|nr:MAG: hypothetical protein AVDCRST_MAG50-1903 [uncultured Acidimicrobiales bacterium]